MQLVVAAVRHELMLQFFAALSWFLININTFVLLT